MDGSDDAASRPRRSKRRRVRMVDVAEAAGVSQAAVSMALNDTGRISGATRQRIKEVAAELGYRPDPSAVALRTGSRRLLGVVLQTLADPSEWTQFAGYWSAVLGAGVTAAAQRGYGVVLIPPDQLDLLDELPLAAVVIADRYVDDAVIGHAHELGLPVVTSFRGDDPRVAATFDDQSGQCEVVCRHLVEAGAERIGLLSLGGERVFNELTETAYRRFCRAHRHEPLIESGAGESIGTAAAALLERGADAIYSAAGGLEQVVEAVEAAGRTVGDDVGVAVVDDGVTDFASLPDVALVPLEPTRIAEVAVELAVGVVEHPETVERRRTVRSPIVSSHEFAAEQGR